MTAFSVPFPYVEGVSTLRADAILTATNVASGPIDVRSARLITLLCNVDVAATTNNPQIIPLGAYWQQTPPATTDDVWYGFNEYDGSNVATLPGVTGLSGADFTMTPEFAMFKARPLLIRFETTDNATDELRIAIPIRVDWCGYFQVHCSDVGTGTLANLEIKYVLSS